MNNSDFKFKKRYGQNFLRDDSIPDKIVQHSEIPDNTLVIEIGPGAAALTRKLAKHAKQVIAYEIDTSLEEVLAHKLVNFSNVRVIFDDFLKRDIKRDIEKFNYEHIYVVANLPYYITTPIIQKLIDSKLEIEKIIIMVQKEVADRFSSNPGSRDYGSITVFLNYHFDIKKLFLVNRNCFIPKPNVDSVILALTKKEKPYQVNNEETLYKLIRDSFQYKRKTLKNNLKSYPLDKIEEVLDKYNLDLTVRAEKLALEVFIEISNIL